LRQSIPLQRVKVTKKCLAILLSLALIAALITAFSLGPGLLGRDAKGSSDTTGWRDGSLVILWVLVGILSLGVAPIYQHQYYKRYFYDIESEHLVIRKGVWACREISLPFSRLTDVYVDQDLLDVWFGLYDVHVSTPTAESGKFAHIDGVSREGAQELRSMILDRMAQTTCEA
jgi:membrane protein YdbS with pleckstrin-like domain